MRYWVIKVPNGFVKDALGGTRRFYSAGTAEAYGRHCGMLYSVRAR